MIADAPQAAATSVHSRALGGFWALGSLVTTLTGPRPRRAGSASGGAAGGTFSGDLGATGTVVASGFSWSERVLVVCF